MSANEYYDVEPSEETPDMGPDENTSAGLVLRNQPGQVGKAMTPEEIGASRPPVTAAQAKVEAVANLTMAAYQQAATLKLSQEEIAALQKDFPDEAFKPGASGKEHLIYIEHPFLRDRLNQVIGPGQWALIPRSRWAENFTLPAKKDRPETEGIRIYVEAMLVVRGAFVSEAVGDMEYYPKNYGQNYGDAVEGAKTAALRRCCKEFGIGLQAWKKDWQDGWWARNRGKYSQNAPGRAGYQGATSTRTSAPKQQAAPKAQEAAPKTPAIANEAIRTRMIALLIGKDGSNRGIVTEYFKKISQLLETEPLEEIPLRFVPVDKAQMQALSVKISNFCNGQPAERAFPPNGDDVGKKIETSKKSVEVPRDPPEVDPDDENAPWRSFPMPWGKEAGVALADLDKKYLFGLWANYEVETEYKGKPKKAETIEKDCLFRDMLDEAGKHYKFEKKD